MRPCIPQPRHDNTGELQPGTIGASAVQRQWIGLSVTGDEVSVEPLPPPPNPLAPSYLQSLDLEVGFLRKVNEPPEAFKADEMAKNFLKAFNNILFAVDEILVFEFHGQKLKAVVKSVGVLELADEQRRGAAPKSQRRQQTNFGILMDKTDITFMKASDSAIKIKSSAKK
jgi:vesicle-fusing ATPase